MLLGDWKLGCQAAVRQDRQRTCNVALRSLWATTVAVEK